MNTRSVLGFPNYSVTQDGVVFGPRRQLKPCPDTKRGYLRVWVYREGKRHELSVHRAVALAWVDGDTSLTVNHKDGNKLNNRASNLEWISNADNMRHSFADGARAARQVGKKRGKSYAIPPDLLQSMTIEVEKGRSMRSVALKAGVLPSTFKYQMKMIRSGASRHVSMTERMGVSLETNRS
jgi:hypothetical protein